QADRRGADAGAVVGVAVGVEDLELHALERAGRKVAEQGLVPGRCQRLVGGGPLAPELDGSRFDEGRAQVDVRQIAISVPVAAGVVARAQGAGRGDDVPAGGRRQLADGRVTALAPLAARLAGRAAGAALVVVIARPAAVAVA